MDLILHAGQHKTGTTSIQKHIADNRRYFLSYGIYIPTTGQVPHLGNHHPLMLDLGSNNGKELMNDLKFELLQNNASKILISAEVVKNFIVENRYQGLFRNLRSLGVRNFRVIIYIRNPFHLINSAYCEQTKSLSAGGSELYNYVERYVSKVYKGHYRFFDYARIIDLAQESDVEVILRPYSAAVAKSVIKDFLANLKLPYEQVFLEPRTNISPGPIAIEALRIVSTDLGQLEPRAKVKIIRKINNILEDFPESLSYWGIDERIAASAAFAKADHQTELLSQFAWSKPWREVIGDDPRPINVFNPATASRGQLKTFERMLDRMRKTIEEGTR